MSSGARMRENHYERLGLKLTASDQEIDDAFTRAMRLPHLPADAAQIAIGTASDLPPSEAPETGLNRAAYGHTAKQSVDPKHSALTLGSLMLAVALIGAWAGAHAQEASPPNAAEFTLRVALPPAQRSADAAPAPAASSRGAAEPDFIPPAVIERARRRLRAKARFDRVDVSGKALKSQSAGSAAEAGRYSPDPNPRLPLPNALIARTIERIGYACGAVAEAVPVEGDGRGTYKLTCTSGRSYRASPVNGRYHFRRW